MLGTGNHNSKMTKLFTIAFLCSLSTVTFSQYDGKGEDEISRFRPGFMWFFHGWKAGEIEKIRKYDRLIFDVTYNDWTGDRKLFQNHWASIGLNTNLMFDVPLTKGNTVSLGIGVGHQYTVIRHNGNLIRNQIDNTTVWSSKLFPIQTFDKSVYGSHAFYMPLEIRFRKESWKHFKVHFGGKIGYQTNAFTKEVETYSDGKMTTKITGFPDENKLVYAAHVRLGLRNWAVYGSYNFNKLFSNSKSTSLNAVQMGVSISLF